MEPRWRPPGSKDAIECSAASAYPRRLESACRLKTTALRGPDGFVAHRPARPHGLAKHSSPRVATAAKGPLFFITMNESLTFRPSEPARKAPLRSRSGAGWNRMGRALLAD